MRILPLYPSGSENVTAAVFDTKPRLSHGEGSPFRCPLSRPRGGPHAEGEADVSDMLRIRLVKGGKPRHGEPFAMKEFHPSENPTLSSDMPRPKALRPQSTLFHIKMWNVDNFFDFKRANVRFLSKFEKSTVLCGKNVDNFMQLIRIQIVGQGPKGGKKAELLTSF